MKNSSEDTPDDDFVKRGEKVGAAIVLWPLLIPCGLAIRYILVSLFSSEMTLKAINEIGGLLCFFFCVYILTMAGSLLGKAGAKCRSVIPAFFWGAFLSCSTISGILLVFGLLLLPLLFFSRIEGFSCYDLIPISFVLAIISALGSLISGLAAIYVRDYRQFQRKRLIPQFTLLEFFIVFTIISIIVSFVTTMAVSGK